MEIPDVDSRLPSDRQWHSLPRGAQVGSFVECQRCVLRRTLPGLKFCRYCRFDNGGASDRQECEANEHLYVVWDTMVDISWNMKTKSIDQLLTQFHGTYSNVLFHECIFVADMLSAGRSGLFSDVADEVEGFVAQHSKFYDTDSGQWDMTAGIQCIPREMPTFHRLLEAIVRRPGSRLQETDDSRVHRAQLLSCAFLNLRYTYMVDTVHNAGCLCRNEQFKLAAVPLTLSLTADGLTSSARDSLARLGLCMSSTWHDKNLSKIARVCKSEGVCNIP